MKQSYVLRCDEGHTIKFDGTLLASVSSSVDSAHDNYSGAPGQWTKLSLYKTTDDRLVCSAVAYTIWEGEHDRHSAKLCDSIDEIKAFFGCSWLAHELYAAAKIEIDEEQS